MPVFYDPTTIKSAISNMADEDLINAFEYAKHEIKLRALVQEQGQPKPQQEQAELRKVPRYPDDMKAGQVVGLTNQAIARDQYEAMSDKDRPVPANPDPQMLRYDLVPRVMIERAAERWTMGMNNHGEREYQLGIDNRAYILNRISHIYEHLHKLFHPDYRNASSPEAEEGIDIKSIRDNLGAILFGVGFLCEVAEHSKGRQILIDLRASGRVKTHSD